MYMKTPGDLNIRYGILKDLNNYIFFYSFFIEIVSILVFFSSDFKTL
jgi:hypothetical protein